ncbi:hypothetical protein CLOSTMETH_00278 [[Clostridium] methylpentosum DSM 5476]|uniref:Uncharacterized protein n=1 Tax=[Clostridium] methylpentosum DSM 5476 TaxID=537013 RepID=C0E8Y3_9FIRM|nr:hypothetical protein CLOSTMETH_00278 [[Clostridium] methylpentosum DSM 5476]
MDIKETYINRIMKMLTDLSETELRKAHDYIAYKWLRRESVINHEE